MKSNIFILCLIDELGINLATEVANKLGLNFYNLSEAVTTPKPASHADLNKLIKNSNITKICSEQLNIVGLLNNSVFYCNNFSLLSQNYLQQLKQTCAVVYAEVDKSTYLENEWQQNLNKASKFKADVKVFETRNKAYTNCADVVIGVGDDVSPAAYKLIKKLEKL